MFEMIRSNKRKSVAMIALFVVVLVAVGAAVGVLIGYGVQGTIAGTPMALRPTLIG